MKKIYVYVIFLLVTTVLLACNSMKEEIVADPLTSHIDSTSKAGDDFFNYANGKWFKSNPIPESEESNGLWQLIQDTINAQIKQICQKAAASTIVQKGSAKQKIGDFYYSGMDSTSINQHGIEDIKQELKAIDDIKTVDDLVKIGADVFMYSSSPFFNFWIAQDDKISNKYAVFLGQGGINLPDRSYYLDNEKSLIEIRSKFILHLEKIFKIMKYDEVAAKAAANQVMQIETRLAKISRKMDDLRDPLKNYNKMPFSELTKKYPNFNWNTYFQTIGFKSIDTVIVGQPEFFTTFNTLIKSIPLNQWKNYLKYNMFRVLSKFLQDEAYMENFEFYSHVLNGTPLPKKRWERTVKQTNSSLGELIGQVYIEEYLPKGTKEKLLEIGNAIKTVYAERIKNLEWMSATTKEKAMKKLQSVIMKVGYPDKWRDMSSITINRDSYVRNVMSVNRWYTHYMVSKFGKPVDRNEWAMYPQTYNAYYNPSNNEICVPGCNIIVPGYERVMADDAILYSIIGGSTFGHEITHGFDDQGCKYNALGNLDNWWTKEDSTAFFTKTEQIVKQFDKYKVNGNLNINGKLTQGENIADLGGVIMGLEAFKKTKQFTKNEIIAGYSPTQRYFLGYALAWMINTRPESLANQVRTDVHSPAQYRVIGPLSNIPDFYQAFGVKEGDKMWQSEKERVKIW